MSAMCIRRIGHQTSLGKMWCNVGPGARNLPIISDGLWETRATHTPTRTIMRGEKSPVGPQSKGLVFKYLREIMFKTFEELALRPKTHLPLEDLNLPESDEDEADVTEVSGFNSWQAQGNVATSATPFAPSKHEPVSRTTEAVGAADASTRATGALTQEERQAEIYRADEMKKRRIADAWDGVAQETAQDRPQAGGRVCVACQRHRSNAQSRCECNEGQYWTIPERAWIEAVSRLKGVTIIDPGSGLPILRHSPRGGLPTGNPTSKEEHADMSRNYPREHGATWELNNYVGSWK
jgi:hypothetical protein